MIVFSTATSQNDLQGILELQRINLARNLTHDEIKSQGFVTVNHTFDQLSKLNDYEKHIIAKDNDKIIGYLLAMTQKSRSDIPILVAMFKVFNETSFNDKTIADYNYIVVGQVCIDKSYRGQGILDKCYDAYKKYYCDRYDFAITEIAKTNTRSLNAHKRIGFKEIKTYTSPDNIEWTIVIWNW
jgi:L-amino acid N-acyltransferase YncA